MLARRMEKFSVIRSMTHKNGSHNSTAMLTGFDNKLETFGAVVTKLKGADQAMPPYVHVGSTPGDGKTRGGQSTPRAFYFHAQQWSDHSPETAMTEPAGFPSSPTVPNVAM